MPASEPLFSVSAPAHAHFLTLPSPHVHPRYDRVLNTAPQSVPSLYDMQSPDHLAPPLPPSVSMWPAPLYLETPVPLNALMHLEAPLQLDELMQPDKRAHVKNTAAEQLTRIRSDPSLVAGGHPGVAHPDESVMYTRENLHRDVYANLSTPSPAEMLVHNFMAKYGNDLATPPSSPSRFYIAGCANVTTPVTVAIQVPNVPAKYENELWTSLWSTSGFYSAGCSRFTTPMTLSMPVTNCPDKYGNDLATLPWSPLGGSSPGADSGAGVQRMGMGSGRGGWVPPCEPTSSINTPCRDRMEWSVTLGLVWMRDRHP